MGGFKEKIIRKIPRRRPEIFDHLQGVYKGFTLIFERRRRENFGIPKNKNIKKVIPMFPKNKNQQNSEDLIQKIRTVKK